MASSVTDSKTPRNRYVHPWPEEGEPEYSKTEDSAEALANAMTYWGNPLLLPNRCSASQPSRKPVPWLIRNGMGGEPLPGDAPERAADADRDLPRHAGELTMAKPPATQDEES